MKTKNNSMNEVTFVAKLGAFTHTRYQKSKDSGQPFLIAQGNIEEAQRDGTGRVKRCDMRLATSGNRKLVSGEMKRPEIADGRDPRNTALVSDARNKAIARGLPLYFTCNLAQVVLWEVSLNPSTPDIEIGEFNLAPIKSSSEVDAYISEIETNWNLFLTEVERHLTALGAKRPPPTSVDVIRLQGAIGKISDEAVGRAETFLQGNPTALEATRTESTQSFGYPFALDPKFKADFRHELAQVLRLAAFVVAQKLILYRVLSESGKRLSVPFTLDEIVLPNAGTDPNAIQIVLDHAIAQAIKRSGDFETVFLPTPNASILFLEPTTKEEISECRVGEAWHELLDAIAAASWSAISHNLVGFLYEAIVDPEYRHALGQHYTQENVVDLITAFAIRKHSDVLLDPASGGGSFLASAYARKRQMGATHVDALAEIWGCEITSFAAELATVTLATADTTAASAYPRVLLMDFFVMRPGMKTGLEIPGIHGKLKIPKVFDAIVGNPPYISYRHQTNQEQVLKALGALPAEISLPKLSGKSDEYVWFLLHATQFLKNTGRLGFVVSSAILFSDYGIPLIRFLAKHYRILAVIDSMVERWFIDADTNTVLLMLERENDQVKRETNEIRFIRLRRPLAQILPPPLDGGRRDGLEATVDLLLLSPHGDADPRFTCVKTIQGADGGIVFAEEANEEETFFEEDKE